MVNSEHLFNIPFQEERARKGTALFMERCAEGLLTEPFPQYICALLTITSMSEKTPFGPMNATIIEKFNELVDLNNHPCRHSDGLSCIVLFLPLDRILFGCVDLRGTNLTEPANFLQTFVVPHSLSSVASCEYDSEGQPICSLDSVFVEKFIVQETHSCCCQSGHCGVLFFDQSDTILPFVKIVVDIQNIISVRRRRSEPVAAELKKSSEDEEFPPVTSGASSSSSFLPDLVLPTVIILIFVCAVLLYSCVDDMDARDGKELGNYGMKPEEVNEMFPKTCATSMSQSPAPAEILSAKGIQITPSISIN